MKIAVELDKRTLTELLKATGQKTNGSAVALAVRNFLNRKKAKTFGRMMREGAFDYPPVQIKLENI